MTASMLLPRRNKSDFAMWSPRNRCGFLGDAPAMIAQSAGAKFVYAGMHARSAACAAGAGGIRPAPLADIKGKKIGFARCTSAENVMLRLLAKADLTYGDIVPIYLSPADASAAGDVDASIIWDRFFRQKMRAIATTKDIVNRNSV
jgi:sulfonate transport system substrate-binding protein